VPTELRLLTSADEQDYKRIRLNALKLEPTAFSSAWETAKELPDTFYADRANSRPDSFIIGVFDEHSLVATGGGFVEPDLKRRHIGNVVGMWVEPSHRSQGIARKLIEAIVIELNKLPHVTSIQLTVTAINTHAVALYQDCGFVAWGEEPNALLVDGMYYNELHMLLGTPYVGGTLP
jgi:ribosomal protein S18 acetylase RimI-like enzyme